MSASLATAASGPELIPGDPDEVEALGARLAMLGDGLSEGDAYLVDLDGGDWGGRPRRRSGPPSAISPSATPGPVRSSPAPRWRCGASPPPAPVRHRRGAVGAARAAGSSHAGVDREDPRASADGYWTWKGPGGEPLRTDRRGRPLGLDDGGQPPPLPTVPFVPVPPGGGED